MILPDKTNSVVVSLYMLYMCKSQDLILNTLPQNQVITPKHSKPKQSILPKPSNFFLKFL